MISWWSHFESFSWFDQDKVTSKLNELSQLCQLVRMVTVNQGLSKALQNRRRGQQLTRCKWEMKSERKKNEVQEKDSIYVSEKAVTGDAHAFLNQRDVKLSGANINIQFTKINKMKKTCTVTDTVKGSAWASAALMTLMTSIRSALCEHEWMLRTRLM